MGYRIQIPFVEAIHYYKLVEPEKCINVNTPSDLDKRMGCGRSGTAIPKHLLLDKHRKLFEDYMRTHISGGYVVFTCWKEVHPPIFEIWEF